MKYYWAMFIFLILLLSAKELHSQSWNLVKEKDGIKIYTRNELNSSLKSFRGEITFKADVKKVNLLIGNANNIEWWVKDIGYVKVIDFRKDEFSKYYLIYRVPWPLTDRDVAVDARISHDTLTGVRVVFINPLPKAVAVKPDLVRIEEFWEKWTIKPMDKGYVQVIFEGFVDPNGNVPYWLYNMTVTDTPLKVLQNLRARALSDEPAIE
jgi:hypothetical protein